MNTNLMIKRHVKTEVINMTCGILAYNDIYEKGGKYWKNIEGISDINDIKAVKLLIPIGNDLDENQRYALIAQEYINEYIDEKISFDEIVKKIEATPYTIVQQGILNDYVPVIIDDDLKIIVDLYYNRIGPNTNID